MCCCDKPKTETKPGAGSCCGAPNPATPTTEADPVCGMKVDPAKAASREEHGGKTYYFCSQGCATKFHNAPDTDLKPKEKAAGSSVPAASPKPSGYTCPMHPDVHKDGPGDCPKCGMALEPETMTAPASRTQYTCPMHHQIIRDEPGICPICG